MQNRWTGKLRAFQSYSSDPKRHDWISLSLFYKTDPRSVENRCDADLLGLLSLVVQVFNRRFHHHGLFVSNSCLTWNLSQLSHPSSAFSLIIPFWFATIHELCGSSSFAADFSTNFPIFRNGKPLGVYESLIISITRERLNCLQINNEEQSRFFN